MKRLVKEGLYPYLKFIFFLFFISSSIASNLDAQEQVWPGDCNRDGIVNNYDLLAIGYAFGTVGPARPPQNQGGTFDGVDVEIWPNELPVSGINYGYIDCNGDGVIDTMDVMIVDSNYYRTQTSDTIPQIDSVLAGLTGVLSFEIPVGEFESGDTVMVRVELEAPGWPTFGDTVLGISFSVNYDIRLTRDSATQIHFNPSWLGGEAGTINYGNILDLLTVGKTKGVKDEAGQIDVTIIDKQLMEKMGSGEVAVVCIIMDENVSKLADSIDLKMDLVFSDVKLITAQETSFPVQTIDTFVTINILNPCERPDGIKVIPLAADQATLAWDSTATAIGYELRGRQIGTNSWITVPIIDSTNSQTTVPLAGLPLNKTYEWQVRAYCKTDLTSQIIISPWSKLRRFGSGCIAPYELNTSKSGNFILLEWNLVLGASSYMLYGHEVNSPSVSSIPVSASLSTATNQPSYLVSGLAPSTYEWAVQSICAGSGDVSGISSINSFSVQNNPLDSASISKIEFDPDLILYPNPANNLLYITGFLGEQGSVSVIEIFNLQGQILMSKSITFETGNVQEVDIRTLADGVYMIRWHDAQHSVISKFVVEN